MSQKFPKGFKFVVPTEAQLFAVGWIKTDVGSYEHFIFDIGPMEVMISNFSGQTLTVVQEDTKEEGWYSVAEDHDQWIWPVQACLDATKTKTPTFSLSGSGELEFKRKYIGSFDSESETVAHACSPSMTPVMGMVICKECGKDLKKAY